MVETRDAVLIEMRKSLNEQQRKAVEFDHTKALQVIAGPGTGKTKVLTSRVAYLLLKQQISPQDIIVTTFTNKAAKEMIDRLVHLLSPTKIRVLDIMIGTFHSICLKILTRFGHKIGLRKDWRIIDENEVNKIFEDMIEKMPDQVRDYVHSIKRKVNFCTLKKDKDQWVVHPKLVKKEISRLKAYAIIPEEYIEDSEHDNALAYFYQRYQEELNKLNALDFDDLLMYTFRLMTKERCLPYIKHVFVDEFQDTNGIQMDLMFLFARGNHHVSRGMTAVGDPDQSIYAFRHALSNNFEAMANKCPLPVTRVILVENYRSSQKILNTSETLIRQQQKGRPDRLPLKAQFDCDFPPVYTIFPACFLEAPSLIRELIYLKSLPGLFSYDDFAILVRQRRQIKSVEKAMIEHQIPYKIIRGHGFWELKEVISMVNLLKCLHSKNETHAIVSSLQYPPRGLGQTSAERIKSVLENENGDSFDILRDITMEKIKVSIPTKARAVLKEFIAMIDTCNKLCEGPLTTALDELFEKLYAMSGMRYEYLYLDGKKKSEVETSADPDFSNPRHKNITVLKNYFLGSELATNGDFKEHDNTEHSKRANVNTVKTHIRNFFLSLSMYTSDVNTSQSDLAPSNHKEKTGFVTVSTIHGAKGLEWPVVFIPGCEEGIIPSIFGEEKDDESEEGSDNEANDNNDNQKLALNTGSPNKKTYVTSAGDSLNEERRMFFVAQTRAKHLLYLSAVDTNEGARPSSPSRFLTNDVLHTMADEQHVFDSTNNIYKLYKLLNKKVPNKLNGFSLKQLVSDYNEFVEKRRERFIWNGAFVHNMFHFDITRNTTTTCINEFTTAAIQLQRESSRCSPEKKNGTKLTSPNSRTHSSNYEVGSHSKSPEKRLFAPSYIPDRSNVNMSISRGTSVSAGQDNSAKKLDKHNTHAVEQGSSLHGENTTKNLTKGVSDNGLSKEGAKKERGYATTALSPVIGTNYRTNRKLVAAPIEIAPLQEELKPKSEKNSQRLFEASDEDDDLNATAGQILHNPNDMLIDTRPIISNAKTLADAVKKNTKKRNNSRSSQLAPRISKFTQNQKIKSEPNESDIFSRLSRAKKKAKASETEIIIID